MDDTAEPLRRLEANPPVHKTVQQELKRYIVAQGLRAGDPLKPEAELARLFGVSRNSVREAVKALESTGVLETRRGSGVYVREFSFAPLLDNLPYALLHGQDRRALGELLELRKVLETALIGAAMRALTAESIAAIEAVLTTMRERAERGEPVTKQDRQFHRLLFTDLGNTMLLVLFDLFWDAFNRAAPPTLGRTRMQAYEVHARIFEAVLSGEPLRARAAVEEHYTGIQERLAASEAEASREVAEAGPDATDES